MRFWQAMVTAQMAAGAVWADERFRDHLFAHAAADLLNVGWAAGAWLAFRYWYERDAKDQADA